MEDPTKELRQVIRNLTECNDAVLHGATIDKYRDAIKRVYAVYKVLTKNIHIEFQDITFDKTTSRAVVELEEYGSSSFDYFNLMPRRPIKIVVILDLWRDASGGGQYYIAKQYDAFPADKLFDALPFGFLYHWWRGLATITGGVIGALLQTSGTWATA